MGRLALFAALLAVIVGTTACDPYAAWPDPTTVYPYVYTPQTDLEDYETVRYETETWDPAEDFDMVGLYLLKASYHRPGAPDETLDHHAAMRGQIPPLGAGVRLSFVGDVMYVGDNWDTFATPAAGLLDGDLRIGNLETPTSADHPTDLSELGGQLFNAPPEMLDGLPLDLLQLNNNHTLDMGDAGLDNTLAEVEARGVQHTGIDTHATVTVGGLEIAFVSYAWGLNRKDEPTAHELHLLPFGHMDETLDLTPLEQDVTAARAAGADAVVLLVHWGFEYEYYADPHFMVLGRQMIAAGADVVVGQGPHVAQPAEICAVNDPEEIPGVGTCAIRTDDEEPRTAAILYSLGNFGTIMHTAPCEVGLVATVSLDPDVTGLGWAAAATVGGPEIHPLGGLLDDPGLAAEAARLDDHLGTNWKR